MTVVKPIELQEEMERSFLDYAMSVIVSRALPDVRDGLKPVHRRILYAMFNMGLRPERPYTKCARVVGDVMGRFHPHGDSAIYDSLARMVQDFSLRHPLIDGHGNFGSTGPDEGPAAMRYTECRLAPISLTLLESIEEDTVNFVQNYDASELEPVVLPSRIPNLLINGSQGIAVGMATNIPPHNLAEVIDATIYVLSHQEATPDDLMAFIKGPDFPTGGLLLGTQGIKDAYRTGRGSIKIRAVSELEEIRNSTRIIFTELPYQTSVEVIEKKIADLVKDGVLEGISRLQNDSAGREARLVVEVRRDANAEVVLNNLYKYTSLQTSVGVNMLAIVDGVPRTLNLAQLLHHYIEHQLEVVTRRCQFRLNKAQNRAHIVEGLLRAIDLLDEVIEAIRNSPDRPAAKSKLMDTPFEFSEPQTDHILDLTLGRLTRLGRSELKEEYLKLQATIAELQGILGSEDLLRRLIIDELKQIRAKFAEPRRSRLETDPGELVTEDLIADDELFITMTTSGYINSISGDAFKSQARGGRGVQGTKLKESDVVTIAVHTTAHSHLLLFSNKGRVFKLRAYQIPLRERSTKGTAIINLLPIDNDERIEAIISTRDFEEGKNLFFVTQLGQVKKTPLIQYNKSRREGIIAISLNLNDELVKVVCTNGNNELLLVTKKGMCIRFKEDQVRPTGRDTAGVRGITLKQDDQVVACDVISEGMDAVFITTKGFGKRTVIDNFRAQARGGKGVKAIGLTPTKGVVTNSFIVSSNSELLLVSSGGVVIKMAVDQISLQGRAATGVKLMNLDEDHKLAAVAPVYTPDTADYT